ncbi:unnamed protein product [Acanthoscelides obtectus]|uniref:Uncharacterized protein n=1 Tax=Acanthoscelides obtectus TaxID=200917 RepID=A0A9P0PCB2_ACAOB|nr:unnamed protein product [Acanthoscelides obtectus]CAK1682115.1 hypothetical protein AOBTE_LOCUS33435 [Acanthoscelides obtectus]
MSSGPDCAIEVAAASLSNPGTVVDVVEMVFVLEDELDSSAFGRVGAKASFNLCFCVGLSSKSDNFVNNSWFLQRRNERFPSILRVFMNFTSAPGKFVHNLFICRSVAFSDFRHNALITLINIVQLTALVQTSATPEN